jgi:hypothetical protein
MGLSLARYIPILVGLASFALMGDTPSWRRTLIIGVLGLLLGAVADTAYPYLIGMPLALVQHIVAVPLVGPYGLSIVSVTILPIAILAAMVAARRAGIRPIPPNDLRS